MRILLVDDSALARGILGQVIEEAGFTVVGQASSGVRGVEMTRDLRPDLVIMDINMPLMDGLTATRHIMAEGPVPILILSTEMDAKVGFEAVRNGALDVMLKPQITDFNDPSFLKEFLEKIETLSKSRPKAPSWRPSEPRTPGTQGDFQVVVVGASTGGPLAVRQVLESLPASFPLGMAVVQHMEHGFDQSYAAWLQETCRLEVRLARSGDTFRSGLVLIAPVGSHLICRGNGVELDDGPLVLNQKPAADVLFRSAAQIHGRRTLGVLLTGMGSDGAEGCLAVKKAGGWTLVQDEATSAIYGMPRVAAEIGGASEVLGLDAIGPRLVALTQGGAG